MFTGRQRSKNRRKRTSRIKATASMVKNRRKNKGY